MTRTQIALQLNLSFVHKYKNITETIMLNIKACHAFSEVSIMINWNKAGIFEIISDLFNLCK